VTPFQNGKVDYASLEKLVSDQIKNGIEGFVINGTTAESPTLSEAETEEIFHCVKRMCGPQIPLIFGTGSNSTEKTVYATQRAEKLGADAALVVVPYYNKPPQRGLAQHFRKTAENTGLPIILYNVPGRTITALALDTIVELSKIKNIVGIKEASGKIDFAKEIREACGPEFTLLSGDDGTYADFLAAGGHGVISVATHILPAQFSAWTREARKGNYQLAQKEMPLLLPLIDLLFSEANPIPVKKALQMMELISSAEMRLPLVELEEKNTAGLRQAMMKCGILK
jgi:4-hydroxy-tetrahydrodipicolinate synthase